MKRKRFSEMTASLHGVLAMAVATGALDRAGAHVADGKDAGHVGGERKFRCGAGLHEPAIVDRDVAVREPARPGSAPRKRKTLRIGRTSSRRVSRWRQRTDSSPD